MSKLTNSYNSFIESICKIYGVEAAIKPLQEGFRVIQEAGELRGKGLELANKSSALKSTPDEGFGRFVISIYVDPSVGNPRDTAVDIKEQGGCLHNSIVYLGDYDNTNEIKYLLTCPEQQARECCRKLNAKLSSVYGYFNIEKVDETQFYAMAHAADQEL